MLSQTVDCFARPEIKLVNHSSILFVDGQPITPMAFCLRGDRKTLVELSTSRAEELTKAGFKMFVIFMQSGWQNEDEEGFVSWEYTLQQADTILKENPKAVFLIRLSCHPSKKWFDENPDELVLFEDGRHDRFRFHSYGSFEDKRQVCYASEKYANDAVVYIKNAIDFVESNAFGKRVIGYHVEGGCCGEWNYLRGTDDDICGDFSPAFRIFYSKWLKKKYETDEALRKAWNDSNASLINPHIPTTREQVFTEGEIAHNGRRDPEGDFGNFLDPAKSQFLIDYYEARTAGTAHTIEIMAKAVKERTNNRVLTGAFWGTIMGVSAQTYAVCGPLFLADSPYIDYLTTPSQYYDRQPGGGSTFRMAVDSMRLRGKLWINESDTRTHLADPHNVVQFCGCSNLQETADVLNRDFAQVLCDDVYGWWFEMATGEYSFYDHPEISAIFKKQQKIAKEFYELGKGKNSEIAVVYDQDSMFSHPFESMRDIVTWNRSQTISRIGAPCDHIFHDDLEFNNLPDYKMYIFLNCHSLTNSQRKFIDNKVKRNGATVVWAYANGLINPEAHPALSVENMQELTGFKFGYDLSPRLVTFRITDTQHSLTKNISELPLYGRLPRPLTAGFSFMPGENMVMDETLASPLFYVEEDEAKTLGRFVANDKTAYAVKEFDSWRSVYIGSKILPANILRTIARQAGVHIYLEDGNRLWPFRNNDIIYANKHFVSVVAEATDLKKITMPYVCTSINDALSNEVIAENTDQVQLKMHAGETRILRLFPQNTN